MKTHKTIRGAKLTIIELIVLIAATVFVLSLISCTKCGECTRHYSSESYTETPDGQHLNVSINNDYMVETFDVCGSQDIKNAEKQTVQTFRQPTDNGNVFVSIVTGTCNCTTK